MKDRLIELLSKHQKICNENCTGLEKSCYRCSLEQLADYILADGWTRPPCKVGDKVYLVTPNGKINEINITDIYIEIKPTATVMRLSATFYVDNKPYFFQVSPFDFGKTIFLTREDAQAKLKEGGKG